MDQNKFVEVKAKVEVRQGAKRPWLEMVITGQKEGKEVQRKLICREVKEFYSERATAEDFGFES